MLPLEPSPEGGSTGRTPSQPGSATDPNTDGKENAEGQAKDLNGIAVPTAAHTDILQEQPSANGVNTQQVA